MIRRVTKHDFILVFHYVGRIIFGIGFIMIVPLVTSLLSHEFSTALDFVIGISVCFIFGLLVTKYFKTTKSPSLFHAMLITAITWLIACLFGAVPHYLSGHFGSFLDAYFDVMSGFTTTGLSIIKDLDHVSNGLNMWRHILTYVGGQGIIVLALTFLVKASGGAFKIMAGEGKDEALVPSVKHTAHIIWNISLWMLVVGALSLSIIAWIDGFSFARGFLHGTWMFMSAWSTGGFAPMSQNAIFYHSFAFEIGNEILMILGSFNFVLHYSIWRGKIGELRKNIEIRSFLVTLTLCLLLVTIGLAGAGIFNGLGALIRRGLFVMLSAHTGTGQMTIYAAQFNHSWAQMAMMGVFIAMIIGGSMASTAGGLKNMRVALLFKGIWHEIKRLITPESAYLTTKYHHIKDTSVNSEMIKQTALIVISFFFLFLFGTIVGLFFNYSLDKSAFEAISAGANVGLSNGITSSAMPTLLKVVYIFLMWIGRLEFMAVYVFFGAIGLMIVRKKRAR
jgi:trk/ktr system potassium uptake protein